ncbi:MAG: hypothetical protein KJZ54_07545 [Phycisphaerales bacterium]|nr:hypothetical protein [Phycisphaerales bacterium]
MIRTAPKPDHCAEPAHRYVYWIDAGAFGRACGELRTRGYRLCAARATPRGAVRTRGRRLVYTPPVRSSGLCDRSGSWYRESMRAGLYMIVSDHRLPEGWGAFLSVKVGGRGDGGPIGVGGACVGRGARPSRFVRSG